jgi:hypothetical protein
MQKRSAASDIPSPPFHSNTSAELNTAKQRSDTCMAKAATAVVARRHSSAPLVPYVLEVRRPLGRRTTKRPLSAGSNVPGPAAFAPQRARLDCFNLDCEKVQHRRVERCCVVHSATIAKRLIRSVHVGKHVGVSESSAALAGISICEPIASLLQTMSPPRGAVSVSCGTWRLIARHCRRRADGAAKSENAVRERSLV